MLSVHMSGIGGGEGRGGKEEGRSPSRVFFRASTLICLVINLGRRKDLKGRKVASK